MHITWEMTEARNPARKSFISLLPENITPKKKEFRKR